MPVSLSKLDMPWLSKDRKCQPGRYITSESKQRRMEAARRAQDLRSAVACPYFAPDVDAIYGGSWKSVIDGTEISSRSNWREHNKRNDVVDVGDKFWAEDGDDVARTERMMGYDPSLIGSPDFYWGKDAAD